MNTREELRQLVRHSQYMQRGIDNIIERCKMYAALGKLQAEIKVNLIDLQEEDMYMVQHILSEQHGLTVHHYRDVDHENVMQHKLIIDWG